MKKTYLIYLTAIIAIASALAGCGGSGGHSINSAGRAGGVVSMASGQVAAVAFVQLWSELLWGVVTNQTGTQTPSFTDPEYNPGDNSWTSTLTTADGTWASVTTFADESSRIDITRPDGTTQTVTQSAPVSDGGSKLTRNHTVASSDGLSVEYTSVDDDQGSWWDMGDDTVQLEGSSTLPEGVTQTFEVSTVPGETTVRSVQSDGSTFTLNVPLTSPDFQPDYTKDATGTYVSSDFNISFTLTHPQTEDPIRWSVMSSDLGQQMTGAFSLNSDFSGNGQLEETGSGGQTLIAILTWQQHGDTQIDLLSGQSRQTRPAGAALDYLQHRWQTLAAMQAPAPGL